MSLHEQTAIRLEVTPASRKKPRAHGWIGMIHEATRQDRHIVAVRQAQLVDAAENGLCFTGKAGEHVWRVVDRRDGQPFVDQASRQAASAASQLEAPRAVRQLV